MYWKEKGRPRSCKLPFVLLSDPAPTVLRSYSAGGKKQMYGRTVEETIRSTVVVRADGKVLKHWPQGQEAEFHPGEVPPGDATVGAPFETLEFGWDNEFPERRTRVPGFRIDATPITNGQFLDFVESGAYDDPRYWRREDWLWKSRFNVRHPHFWTRRDFGVSARAGPASY